MRVKLTMAFMCDSLLFGKSSPSACHVSFHDHLPLCHCSSTYSCSSCSETYHNQPSHHEPRRGYRLDSGKKPTCDLHLFLLHLVVSISRNAWVVRVSSFFDASSISFLPSIFLFGFSVLAHEPCHVVTPPSVVLTCQLMNNTATVRYGVQFTTGPSQEKPKAKPSWA